MFRYANGESFDDVFGEDDNESFLTESDDEDFEREAFVNDESAPARRNMPRFQRQAARFATRANPQFRAAQGTRTTSLRSPSGKTTKVELGSAFATVKDLNAFKEETKKAIMTARQETKDNFTKLDGRLNTFTKTLDTKINTIDADLRKTVGRVTGIENSSRLSGLMPLLMGKPEIETISFSAAPEAGKPIAATVKYKDDNSILLPLLLTGGLGGSGSGGSGGMDNMALLAIAMMK